MSGEITYHFAEDGHLKATEIMAFRIRGCITRFTPRSVIDKLAVWSSVGGSEQRRRRWLFFENNKGPICLLTNESPLICHHQPSQHLVMHPIFTMILIGAAVARVAQCDKIAIPKMIRMSDIDSQMESDSSDMETRLRTIRGHSSQPLPLGSRSYLYQSPITSISLKMGKHVPCDREYPSPMGKSAKWRFDLHYSLGSYTRKGS
jgi:hypothetical protein